MTPVSTTRPMTAEEFLDLPDDWVTRDLVRGELVDVSKAGGRQSVTWLSGLLLGQVVMRDRLGCLVAAETGFITERDPDTVRAPDIAFVTAVRLPLITDDAHVQTVPPDLAVEVLSPNDRPGAVADKLDSGDVVPGFGVRVGELFE